MAGKRVQYRLELRLLKVQPVPEGQPDRFPEVLAMTSRPTTVQDGSAQFAELARVLGQPRLKVQRVADGSGASRKG